MASNKSGSKKSKKPAKTPSAQRPPEKLSKKALAAKAEAARLKKNAAARARRAAKREAEEAAAAKKEAARLRKNARAREKRAEKRAAKPAAKKKTTRQPPAPGASRRVVPSGAGIGTSKAKPGSLAAAMAEIQRLNRELAKAQKKPAKKRAKKPKKKRAKRKKPRVTRSKDDTTTVATSHEAQELQTMDFYRDLLKKKKISPTAETGLWVNIDTSGKNPMAEVVLGFQVVMEHADMSSIRARLDDAVDLLTSRYSHNNFYASIHYYATEIEGKSPDGEVFEKGNLILYSAWSGVPYGPPGSLTERVMENLDSARFSGKTVVILHEILVRATTT
jgi:hypothetical protein